MRSKIAGGVAVVVVLAGLGAGSHWIWHTEPAVANGESEEAGERIPVVLTPARQMTFEERIVVSGNVEAKNYALVSARMPGPLDSIYVDEGDRVEAGKTKLFQTDSVKLTKAVAMAEQGLRVEEFSVREKEASVEQVLADKEQARVDLERYQELLRHNAVPKQQVEQQESRFKQAAAMVKHAEALAALDRTKLEQARVSLTMAEKDLADSLVVAPISGRVSERFKEPGEMAAAGTPVVKIEDPSLLEVSVFAPEEYYARVLPGQTKMRVRVGAVDLGSRPVSYKSPTVHSKLRTFEVKGVVESPPKGMVPGCLAEVTIVADSRSGVGVPSGAVQTRGGRSVLFVATEDKAKMVPVKTGRDTQGWTEILDGLSSGASVISMGQTLVEEGTPISTVEEDLQ